MKIKTKIEDLDQIEFELIKKGLLKESKDVHYVNNKQLYEEYVIYNKKKKLAIESGLPIPPLSNKICLAIMQIANRRCRSREFVGYSQSWKEELIQNAIMIMTIRGHNFDPEKSKNPFAYLTQICNNGMWEQLARERKQLYVKYKSIEDVKSFNAEIAEDCDLTKEDLAMFDDSNQFTIDRNKYVYDYEQKHLTKLKRKPNRESNCITLEGFL